LIRARAAPGLEDQNNLRYFKPSIFFARIKLPKPHPGRQILQRVGNASGLRL
jgi:hypothetical protein